MKILVIIPILNPPKTFFDTYIPKLMQQTKKVDILLINSGADIQDSVNYQVINIKKEDFNHANTRNIALKFPTDFYLFMTQDALAFDLSLIENLLKPFEDEAVVVTYARQIPYEDAHIIEQFARNKNYPDLSIIKSKENISNMGIKTYFTSDSCAMYRETYFKKVDGFKKDLNTSEDMEFAARAIWDNKKVAYNADAKVYHSHNYTVKDLFKRYVQIGKFFKENHWIEESIKDIKSTEKTGFEYVINELRYIIKNNPLAFFRSCIFILTKFIAYKIGKYCH